MATILPSAIAGLKDNLGVPTNLGNAAVRNVGADPGTVAAGDDTRIVSSAKISALLSQTPEGSGAIGSGLVDDTSFVQTALNKSLSSTVKIPNRYLLQNILLPARTAVQGVGGNGIVRYDQDWYAVASQFRVTGGATIRGGASSLLQQMLIIADGLTSPFASIATGRDNLTRFAAKATAITYGDGSTTGFNASDAMIRDTTIIGFNQAVTADGTDTALYAGRFDMRDVKIDCNSGVYLRNIADVCRIENVHCWPFSCYIPGHSPVDPATFDIIQRPGVAFQIVGACDWAQLRNCFSYGYRTSVLIDSASNIQVIGHQADNVGVTTANAGGKTVYKDASYIITGNSELARLIDCTSISHPTGVRLTASGSRVDAKRTTLHVNSGVWICTDICFDLVSGHAIIEDVCMESAQVGVMVRLTMGDVKIKISQAGAQAGDGAHMGTLVKVEAGYAGYLDIEIPNQTPGNWETTLDIPDATLRNGRVTINGKTPWVAYNPGISSASGALGSATSTGRYQIVGTRCYFQVQIVISDNGTGSGSLRTGIPVAAKSQMVFVGRRDGTDGIAFQAVCNAGLNNLLLAKFDNSYLGQSGAILTVNGVFETA